MNLQNNNTNHRQATNLQPIVPLNHQSRTFQYVIHGRLNSENFTTPTNYKVNDQFNINAGGFGVVAEYHDNDYQNSRLSLVLSNDEKTRKIKKLVNPWHNEITAERALRELTYLSFISRDVVRSPSEYAPNVVFLDKIIQQVVGDINNAQNVYFDNFLFVLEDCGIGMDQYMRDFFSKNEIHDIFLLKLICHQVLSGLYYLHSALLIHRDLKPSNICIRRTETNISCKIIDLGLARSLTGENGVVVYPENISIDQNISMPYRLPQPHLPDLERMHHLDPDTDRPILQDGTEYVQTWFYRAPEFIFNYVQAPETVGKKPFNGAVLPFRSNKKPFRAVAVV